MATSGENASDPADAVQHRETIDWEQREPVSSTVLLAVTEVSGRSARELAPLADYVDPDALESFFSREFGDPSTRRLSFEYGDYVVHVDGAGHVSVY